CPPASAAGRRRGHSPPRAFAPAPAITDAALFPHSGEEPFSCAGDRDGSHRTDMSLPSRRHRDAMQCTAGGQVPPNIHSRESPVRKSFIHNAAVATIVLGIAFNAQAADITG